MRLRRICSERKDLKSHVKDLKGWFLRRGYPLRIVKEQVDKAFRLPPEHDTQQSKMENGISLVVTYNAAFRNLSTTLQKNSNICLFAQMQRLEPFLRQFHLFPIVALETLRVFMVSSKVNLLERAACSSKCDSKRCYVCLDVSKTDIFESFQTKRRQYKINHHLKYNNK